MHGYLVADDVSSVLLISAAQEGDFELWHQLRQKHLLAAAQQDNSNTSQKSGSRSGKPQSQKGSSSSRFKSGGGQQDWKAALMKSSSLNMPEGPLPRHKLAALVPQRRTDPGVSKCMTVWHGRCVAAVLVLLLHGLGQSHGLGRVRVRVSLVLHDNIIAREWSGAAHTITGNSDRVVIKALSEVDLPVQWRGSTSADTVATNMLLLPAHMCAAVDQQPVHGSIREVGVTLSALSGLLCCHCF